MTRDPAPVCPCYVFLTVKPISGQSFEQLITANRPGPKRPGAVVTMVYNEPVFMPIWLRYYSRFFDPEDIYVLDQGSTDGSTDGDGFVRIPVSHPTIDNLWRLGVVEQFQHELLDRYDAVLFTDVDEIVAPDPQLGTLGEYLDDFDRDFVNCVGFEVLHLKDREPEIDLSCPVLEQRGHWFPNPGYGKPLLARVPMRWEPGFHIRADGRIERDESLFVIHLHRMDYEASFQRLVHHRARHYCDDDIRTGRGRQNRLSSRIEYEDWFYGDSCFEEFGVRVAPEPIPGIWKGTI